MSHAIKREITTELRKFDIYFGKMYVFKPKNKSIQDLGFLTKVVDINLI